MRMINELIWHCTATPEGREVGVDEIDRWHRARGWQGIGYHKVVHLDGSVSEGRVASRQGAHVKGHNRTSVGYVYVGGLDRDMKAKDTRTPAQRATMRRLTLEAMQRYGIKRVSGHNQYAAKACPSFDAAAEYEDLLTFENGMPLKDPSVLKQSRTLKGAGAGVIGIAGAHLSEAAGQIEQFTSFSDLVKWAFVALTVAGIALTVYARLDDAGLFAERRP